MTVDDILASSVKNEERKESEEAFNKMTKEEQIAYAINTILDVIKNQKAAIDKMLYLIEDLNIQNATMRRRMAEFEVQLDSLEERL